MAVDIGAEITTHKLLKCVVAAIARNLVPRELMLPIYLRAVVTKYLHTHIYCNGVNGVAKTSVNEKSFLR